MLGEATHALAGGAVADLQAELAAEVGGRPGEGEEVAEVDAAAQLGGDGRGGVDPASALGGDLLRGELEGAVEDAGDAAHDMGAQPLVRDDPTDPRPRCGSAQSRLMPNRLRAGGLTSGPRRQGLARWRRRLYTILESVEGYPVHPGFLGGPRTKAGRYGGSGEAGVVPGLSYLRCSTSRPNPASRAARMGGGAALHTVIGTGSGCAPRRRLRNRTGPRRNCLSGQARRAWNRTGAGRIA